MIILITGITSGFGKAMAERLSADGHTVYGTHRKATEFIPGVTYIKADACNEEDCRAAVAQVVDAEGRIDVFINNAGMGIGGPLEFSSLEDVMRRQGSGKIICFSSIGGLMGLPYQGLYSASKFAIEGYCEALRLELRHTGVTVTVIEPGDFSTHFTAQRKSVDNPEANAAYPSYARSLASIEHDEMSGLKPEFLAGKISKIVKMKNPGYSYIIASFLQKLSVFAKVILPKRWFAALLAVYYKL